MAMRKSSVVLLSGGVGAGVLALVGGGGGYALMTTAVGQLQEQSVSNGLPVSATGEYAGFVFAGVLIGCVLGIVVGGGLGVGIGALIPGTKNRSVAIAGWYPVSGSLPPVVRYWDGRRWVGAPRPIEPVVTPDQVQ